MSLKSKTRVKTDTRRSSSSSATLATRRVSMMASSFALAHSLIEATSWQRSVEMWPAWRGAKLDEMRCGAAGRRLRGVDEMGP